MQGQNRTPDYVSGFCNVVVDFELHGRLFEALAAHEATVADVVYQAFLELANLGNDFNIGFHTFGQHFGGNDLRFETQSRKYRPGDRIYIVIGLVGDDAEAAKKDIREHFELWIKRIVATETIIH